MPSTVLLIRPVVCCSVLVAALLTALGMRPVRADEWNTYRLTTRDGLPQNTVTALVQSADGCLWIGTFGGVARFDGVEFEVFEHATHPALANNRIASMHASDDGTIWIGTERGHVVMYSKGTIEPVETPDDVTQPVVAMTETPDGALWIATKNRLLRTATNRAAPRFEHVAVLAEAQVQSLFTHSDGTVWVATSNGVGRIENDRYVPLDGGTESLDSPLVRVVTSDADDRLWMLPNARRIDGESWIREPLTHAFGSVIVGHGEAEDLWIASHGRLERITLEPDRSTSTLALEDTDIAGPRSILRDTEGNVWIGTTGKGLLRITPRRFVEIQCPDGSSNNIGAITADRDGTVWFESDHGALVRVDPDGTTRQIESNDIGKSGERVRIQDLATSPDGTLWVARDDGVYRRRADDTFSLFADGPVTSILVKADGTLLTAHKNVIVETRPNVPSVIYELPAAKALELELEHPYGTVWFHDETRIGRIRDGAATWIETETPLPPSIRSLWVDHDETCWVTTYGAGLARVSDGQVDVLTPARGLFDASLGKVLPGAERDLWINSNRGVFRVAIAELEDVLDGNAQRVRCEATSSAEGNGGGGTLAPTGIAWFPSVAGIVGIDPKRWLGPAVAPQVVIRSVVIDGVESPVGERCELPPGDGDLEIRFAAPSLSGEDIVHYRYRLEGYDRNWVEAGTRRSAFYTNLTPGHYRFRVEAAGPHGEWGESTSELDVVPLPLLTESLWFRFVGITLGCLVLFLAHHWRTSRLEAWNARLRREIEERERAEAEQRALQEELAESKRIETIGRLAGGIAHDFNNFLTVMVGHAELLRSGQLSNASRETTSRIDAILDSCRRASALTRQLLGYSRQQVRTPSRIDPDEVIAALLPLLQRLLPETIRVHVEPSSEPVCVHVDRGQLEQVLMNLAINARDAMPDGGPLLIRTRKVLLDDEHTAEHPGAQAGEHVEISVTDVGCGIREQILPHVFEPFFTTKNAGEGTGLGLASVHGIVVQSGGHVVVHTLSDAGTTFRVYLPSLDAEPESAEVEPVNGGHLTSADSEHGPADGSETILVCEDNEAVRQVICGILRGARYSVLEASQPSEARRLSLRARRLDLLVTDVVMPDESGPRVAQAIRQQHPEARVLFISGYTENEIGDRTDAAGTEFLQKPFESRELLACVRRMLDTANEPSTGRSS